MVNCDIKHEKLITLKLMSVPIILAFTVSQMAAELEILLLEVM